MQEKQMGSLIGGQLLASKGKTAGYSCGASCCCQSSLIPEKEVVADVGDPEQSGSCCKNSCNN